MKLFKIKLRGFHNDYYSVASDPTTAYALVRDDLSNRNIGFKKDRELLSIELLAETGNYPDCEDRLFVEGFKDGESY